VTISGCCGPRTVRGRSDAGKSEFVLATRAKDHGTRAREKCNTISSNNLLSRASA
jgi:hypothetical protein